MDKKVDKGAAPHSLEAMIPYEVQIGEVVIYLDIDRGKSSLKGCEQENASY